MTDMLMEFVAVTEGNLVDIPLYSVSELAYSIYKSEAHKDYTIEKDVLEKKLSAMLNVVKDSAKTYFDSAVYNFNGFCMIASEKTKTVEVIYWQSKDHRGSCLSPEMRKNLKESYRYFGLSGSGNSYVSFIAKDCG